MAQNAKLRDQTREHAAYLSALNRKLDQLTVRVAHLGETMAAIVAHLGEDVITKKMEDMRGERRRKHEEELERGVKFMLDNELAVAAAPEDGVIGENSFVVLDEVAPNGTTTRAQHEMKRLNPEGQKRYLGKRVGDEVTNPSVPGYKVVVRAIYTLDMVKVQQFAAKQRQEAAESAASAPQTDATTAPAQE